MAELRYIGVAEFDQMVANWGGKLDFWRAQLAEVGSRTSEIDSACALVQIFTEQLDRDQLANMLVVALKRLNDAAARRG